MTRTFRPIVAIAGCMTAALLSACGPSTALPPEFSTCLTPKAICMASVNAVAECVDLTSDVNNCGACGNVCGVPQQGGTAACVRGECVPGCQNGLTVCGVGETESSDGGADGGDAGSSGEGANVCVDTSIDPNHCGSCGAHCSANDICTAGVCVPAGTPGQGTSACGVQADGGVVFKNLQTDPANCGACNNACVANEICLAGACDPCPVAQCNNVCVDTNTDVNNCGGCGVVAASCDNGTPRTAPVITVLAPASDHFLPAGTPSVGVSVVSGIRIAQVTVVAKATIGGTTTTSNPFSLTLISDANLSPTSWTVPWGSLTAQGTLNPLVALSATETIEFDFAAYDEQYRAERSDAASHMATLVFNASVIAITPSTLAVPVVTTTIAGAAGGALSTGSWVPLNGGPVVITVTATPAPNSTSGIVGVEFDSIGPTSTVVLGTPTTSTVPFSGSTASVTVNPADLGIGIRTISPQQIDVFGNHIASANTFTLTVGDVVPYSGTGTSAVLTHGTDNNDSIWLFGAGTVASASPCATAAQIFAQAYDQPVVGTNAIGKVVDGASLFCTDALYETAESTGVYGVKTDGSSIARFDGVSAETATFITAPANTKFKSINGQANITGAAMEINDSNGLGWFANATKGVGDPAPEAAGGADGGSFSSIPSLNEGGVTTSSTSGALYSWVDVQTGSAGVQWQVDIFHPVISNNGTHIKTYLAAAGSTPKALQVFPGGEFVWEQQDSGGNIALGAGRFDGTNQPVDITGATIVGAPNTNNTTLSGNSMAVGVAATLDSTAFFVPSPGILVGLIPSTQPAAANLGSNGYNRSPSHPDVSNNISAGYEMIEIDLTQSPAKIYHPYMISLATGVPVGQVLLLGVTDRFGNINTFTVSDDLKKVLYVTKAPAPAASAPAHDEYTINLLDLASGSVTSVYTSEFINNNDAGNAATSGNNADAGSNMGPGALSAYPRFLHGMNSYANLPSNATPPIILWNEELPETGTETLYQRLFYANYSGSTVTPVQIDRLAYLSYDIVGGVSVALRQLVAASVKGNAFYFLSDDGGGVASLYMRPFDGGATAQLVVKGVTNWELREDIGEQEVLRNDGTLLVGPLAGNPLPTPIYKAEASTTDVTLMSLSGFSPDGSKVWALVDSGQALFFSPTAENGGNVFLDSTLVSIDTTTGARTDWGESLSGYLQIGPPSFAFVGPGTSALYGFDRNFNSAGEPRLFSSVATAPSAHSTLFTGVFNPGFNQAIEARDLYSVDFNESIFAVSNTGAFDVTVNKSTAINLPFTPNESEFTAFLLAGQAARVQPDGLNYGPRILPLYAVMSAPNGDGLAGEVFKQFGGATYQSPITIAAGTTIGNPGLSRVTPDFSQLLGNFRDPNAGGEAVMIKLPGPGVAAFATAPQ